MNKEHSVPHLDLAPRLERPLQLWKPLDYLRLLHWCFLFPQGLHWYVEQNNSAKHTEPATRYLMLAPREDPILRTLTYQGLLLSFLMMVFPPIVSVIMQAQILPNPLIIMSSLPITGAFTVFVVAAAVLGEPATRTRRLVRVSALIGVILCTEIALLPQQVSGLGF